MDKFADAALGVVELFAVLLPGVLALGGALAMALGLDEAERLATLASGGPFLVVAYFVGHALHTAGSHLLDRAYDARFKPGSGTLTGPARATSPDGWLARALEREVHATDAWMSALAATLPLPRLHDAQGEPVTPPPPGVYKAVRAYLRITRPEAFAEVERLEAEQKLHRTAYMACALLALVGVASALVIGEDVAARLTAAAGAALYMPLAWFRFMRVRKKTVAVAYLYYGMREI